MAITFSFFWACGNSGVDGAAIGLRSGMYPSDYGSPVTEGFTQVLGGSGNVDILFMLDSSLSFTDTDRLNLSTALTPLVGEMGGVTQAAIAFALAWGKATPDPANLYKGSGHLYKTGLNEYVTVDPDFFKPVISSTLVSSPPLDDTTDGTDGGEAGMYSLHRMLTDPLLRQEAKDRGFLRTGTPLVVIFMSDENDICAVYPPGVVPVPDPQGIEPVARQTYCGSLTAASLFEEAKQETGAPVQFSGIINPPGFVNPAGTEKETGYGYLDAIYASSGVVVDLVSDFSGLKNLGNAINALASGLLRRWQLTPGAGKIVNPNSIRVTVDGNEVTFRFDPTDNSVLLDYAGHPSSVITVFYRVIDSAS